MMSGYKTYLGILIALAPTIAHLFGYQLAPEFSTKVPEFADTVVQILGLILAAYGRAKAEIPGLLVRE